MTRRTAAVFAGMCVIWGVPYLLIRVAVRDLSPATVVCLRTGIGAVLLAPFALRDPSLRAVLARWRWVLLFAAIEMAGPWLLLTDAERRVSSSLSGLLIAAVPLVGVVVARLARSAEQPDLRQVVGVLVGLAGTASLVGLDLGHLQARPLVEILLTVLGYAIAPVVLARRLSDLPGLPVIFVSLAVVALGYLPPALAAPPHAVSATAWLSIVILGVVCTAVAFLLFFALIRAMGPARATVITFVNPAVALVAGMVVLGERFTSGMAVGFPLILLGSVLAIRSPRDQSSVTGPEAVANVAVSSPVASASSTQVISTPSSGCSTELPR